MGIKHDNIDVAAEMDVFADVLSEFENTVTLRSHGNSENKSTLEYVCAEGDPPFGKYRLTLELIDAVSPESYIEIAKTCKPSDHTEE
jgi:hypothetical protein